MMPELPEAKLPHSARRRQLLLAAGLAPWVSLRAATRRVVIVGGGWGGLTAAARLREQLPMLELVLIDRQPAFVSLIGSNPWLVNAQGSQTPRRLDYAAIAARRGYRFVQAEVTGIDRQARLIHTGQGREAYDWLVLAPGIRENFSAWRLSDAEAQARFRQLCGSAMGHGSELAGLKARLASFKGGDLLMNIPPPPYRCPPAPYERALYIAHWLREQKLPGKLTLIDPNPLMPAFRRAFLETYRDQVRYIDHANITELDLEKRSVQTEVEDFGFDLALLSPPQQAADLLWQADLIRRSPQDQQPDGWGAQEGVSLRSTLDPSVFIIGDAAGLVSPLFGAYPKTGHVASRMGAMVADEIARSLGLGPAQQRLPESICHVTTELAPHETMELITEYRRRGDGALMQSVRQRRESNPAGEAQAWAAERYAEFL